jgi:hypothetical protein
VPDAAGNFRGIGWSRKSDAAWDRAFGGFASPADDPATQPPCAQEGCGCSKDSHDIRDGRCPWLLERQYVPHEPPDENPDEMADRAEGKGWGR